MRAWLLAIVLMIPACDVRDEPPGPTEDVEAPTPVVDQPIDQPIDQPAESTAEPTPDWPIYRGDRAMSGHAKGDLDGKVELVWTFKTGEPVVSSAVIAGGAAFIGSTNGNVYAIDLPTGKQVWAFACGPDDEATEVEAPPLVINDRVYVGSTDGVMRALDRKTGEEVWNVKAEDKIVGSANAYETKDGRTLVLFGSYDAKMYAVDAATGERVWTFSTDSYVNGGPAVADDQVVFGGCDGFVYVLDAGSGDVRKRIEIGHPNSGTVALNDGKALIGHYGNAFLSVDLDHGVVRWTYRYEEFPFFSGAATDGRVVVFGGRDRFVHCVKAKDAESVWRYETGGQVDSSPVIAGDRVIVGSDDGRLHIVDLASGEPIQTYDLGDSIVSSPAVAGRWIVIGCEDGNVYAFRHAGGGK
jgi:outer membrane protein assembly factor BamB